MRSFIAVAALAAVSSMCVREHAAPRALRALPGTKLRPACSFKRMSAGGERGLGLEEQEVLREPSQHAPPGCLPRAVLKLLSPPGDSPGCSDLVRHARASAVLSECAKVASQAAHALAVAASHPLSALRVYLWPSGRPEVPPRPRWRPRRLPGLGPSRGAPSRGAASGGEFGRGEFRRGALGLRGRGPAGARPGGAGLHFRRIAAYRGGVPV